MLLKSVSTWSTAVSLRKPPKFVSDMGNPYHVACLSDYVNAIMVFTPVSLVKLRSQIACTVLWSSNNMGVCGMPVGLDIGTDTTYQSCRASSGHQFKQSTDPMRRWRWASGFSPAGTITVDVSVT